MSLIRGNALAVPLADESVDLVVTSPPYFALRSYTDGGEHYDGQIGSESTPAEFVAALLAVTAECVRVLKPSGSLWVNLGDKYSGANAQNYGTGATNAGVIAAAQPANCGIRAKSLMGLPWRYALGCIDDMGLILRAEVIWSKPNGLPESVTDRVRRSHEQWFHFTKEPRYYSGIDEIREPYNPATENRYLYAKNNMTENRGAALAAAGMVHQGPIRSDIEAGHQVNPLGKLPGSVWTIPTEPLRVPDHLPQHFAAFPSEWPRRIILGWSPSGVCVECGEGRRPVVDKTYAQAGGRGNESYNREMDDARDDLVAGRPKFQEMPYGRAEMSTTITGYSCGCPTPTAPTRPAVVLDPFAGTGTTVAVADALGRHGIGLDLSADYLKLARWRCRDPKLRAKVLRVEPPDPQIEGQGVLL